MSQEPSERPVNDNRGFIAVIVGTFLLGGLAYGLSLLLGTPLGPQIAFSGNDILIGVIATLPLVVFLWWFSNTDFAPISTFRLSQVEFFANMGFAFTPWRIVLMAIGAGVSEELLFRGVFQTWLTTIAPVAAAIIVSNIVFGLLHMRTVLYAVIAGCVGVYLGVLYEITGNLLTPIITHMLYDAVALDYARRAVADYQAARKQ